MFKRLKYYIFPAGLSFILMVMGLSELHAQENISFDHLSVNNGLSQSTIFSITQDTKGFLWFGTRGGGLNKYDGYDFQIFRNSPELQNSLSDDEVISMLVDSRGNLWVGTRSGGLNRLILATGRFQHYCQFEEMKGERAEAALAVRTIYEDRSGRIWVGMNHQVCLYNRDEDKFYPILQAASVPVKGTSGICEDSDGNLYFATWDRLIRYNPDTGALSQLLYSEDPFTEFGGRINPVLMDRNDRLWIGTPDGLKIVDIGDSLEFSFSILPAIDWPESFSYVRTIKETRDGLIWFGTRGGLYSYSPGAAELKGFMTEPNNPGSLGHNSVYSIFEDNVGSLWIGTWSGISILDQRKYEFTRFSHLYNVPGSLSSDIVSSFQEDKGGTWVGTEQGGLNFMNEKRTEFEAFQSRENDPKSLPSNNVKSIFLDSDQNLWVGTFKGGLSLLERGTGSFRNFLAGHSVYDIEEMPYGKLWIGATSGLYAMDLKTKEISREVFPPPVGTRTLESFITVLFTDSNERMWIGTKEDGLYLFNTSRAELKHFQSLEADTSSISGDYVLSICEDPFQGIWIGTNSGLNRFDESTATFERYVSKFGIDDNVINGLLSDGEGEIWISTNRGLYQFNPQSLDAFHYDYLDGLQSNEFNRGAYYRNAQGEMFFGGVSGFNVFSPEDIRRNPDAPPVIITDLKLFNESVIPGEKNSPLDQHISETEKIVLTHRQSSFSFDFVALNYLIPEKNNYAYMLEGYEDHWNQSGRIRTAAYMNLKPGSYTFHIRGSNNNKVWNETGSSIDIIVKGPLWASPAAIFFYFVALIGLLVGLIRIVRFRAEKESELNLERAEKDSMRELNHMRLQFFTNISHEFRTPLTLIAGPLDKLMSGRYEYQKDYLFYLMKSNVNRMLRLVNQLMDFRKLENEKMPLHIRKGNLDELVSQIVLGFEDLAGTKMIELKYEADSQLFLETEQWFDEGIIDKVLYNLLSNAFKFTPEHGIIEVRLGLENHLVTLVVSDTGRGIDKEKVTRIFERFYSESGEIYAGTGIGLSLSKRLIDLHRGDIQVESERGKGAVFLVSFPVGKDKYSAEEIISDPEKYIFDRPGLDTANSSTALNYSAADKERSGPTMLIVEDNRELSVYLADHFSKYQTILAENGREAYDLAREKIPDIIISDIMMPEMDGLEFCSRIKQDFLTSHIPVVLLTAKSAVEQKIEGLENGADAYLEKPFDAEYLTILVKNLLVQRKKLKEKFSGQTDLVADDTELQGADKVFLVKVNEIVNQNVSNPEFSVDQLLVEVGMSRSQLYRKFSAISDKNPSEYIRILRLKHAAMLLGKNQFTISEVAFMSGFSNVSYFNTCFKRHFGTSPGRFINSEQA